MARFSELFYDATKEGRKIPQENYLPQGKYPIIDQGKKYVAGYTDEAEGLYNDVPAIIFGDHTRILKYVDMPCFLGADGVKLLKAKEPSANYKYLYYALNSIKIPDTGYNRHFKWLKETEIPLPAQTRQEHIVRSLDTLHDLISLRKQQLAKLDELVKTRFVEMFGDPVSNSMGWEISVLSECLLNIENGKSFVCKACPRQDSWPAILKLSAVTYGFFQPGENKAMLSLEDFVAEAEVKPGDLLFTRKNTPELVGMSAYVFEVKSHLMMPDLIFRLNTNERCNRIFLWQLINHDLFRNTISSLASGSAKSMSNISKERLSSLRIICPPVELQQRFSEFVERTYRQKLTIQHSLDKLEVLKKSLMQEYFG